MEGEDRMGLCAVQDPQATQTRLPQGTASVVVGCTPALAAGRPRVSLKDVISESQGISSDWAARRAWRLRQALKNGQHLDTERRELL